jgi:plasmid stabilization system protein ParE
MKKTPHYKVVVSERCRQMLANHVRFMALKSPSAARNVKNELMAAIRSLHQIPERFPFLEAEFIPPNKYHKMVVDKSYLVLYQIRDQIN